MTTCCWDDGCGRASPGACEDRWVQLPVMPPVSPMLAKAAPELPLPSAFPHGIGFEQKWDGFRSIIFRDGDDVEIGSRNEKPRTRYFRDVIEALKRALPERCVVDRQNV